VLINAKQQKKKDIIDNGISSISNSVNIVDIIFIALSIRSIRNLQAKDTKHKI